MFKKKVLLALGMAAVLSTGCAATSVWAEENADVQAETESTDTEENSEAEGEAEEANPEIEEGYTTELDGCTKVVSWCKMETTIFTDSFIIQLILTKTRLIRWSL